MTESNPYEGWPEDALLRAAVEVEAGHSEFSEVVSEEAKFHELMRICEASRVAKNRAALAIRAQGYACNPDQAIMALRIHMSPEPLPILVPVAH